ncbi:MAG: squalene--hopene cyclase [Acidimicrobiales bacterium]|jgi:squalene-hopene/tetraprenyl-beta-curcumene cyclase
MKTVTTDNAVGGAASAEESSPAVKAGDAVEDCLRRAVDALIALQDPQGWWKGELETNVTMDAEDLLLREFLGIRTKTQTDASARWIRSCQREDGTWANFYGGPAELSTTVEAYVALRLAGDPADAPHMESAAKFVLSEGGVERTRVFTKIWLALFGLWKWSELPVMPAELMFLPRYAPLNIYDFACWARQTVVAMTVINAHRPVHRLDFGIDEIRSGLPSEVPAPLRTWTGKFQALDKVLKAYERSPLKPFRQTALKRAERWIVERQEADGSWGGIQPPWVYSLIALSLQGYDLEHPVMRAGIQGLDTFTIEDESGRRLEACQSPVWDTALAITALRDAGLPADDARLCCAARYLLGEEIRVRGDWSIRRPDLEPAGWAFEFENDNYPDIDDTAEVAIALSRTDVPADAAVARAVAWIEGMQCQDGGWGAFDVDNIQTLCRELPFCDFGALTDPPSADVTAHVLEMLGPLGCSKPAVERGLDWLLRAQEPDGSWFGRWGVNYVYGTGAVVPGLIAAGLTPEHPAVVHAIAWLKDHQNPDGGWGEDLRSYKDESQRGRGVSTASQTAWALLALVAADDRSEATRRGIAFLVDTQCEDGSWSEPWFTGTGFPGDFYINYHLYRLVFPVTALGRFVNGALHG